MNYKAVMLAVTVIALCVIPCLADDADATSPIQYIDHGEVVAYGTAPYNLNVPEATPAEGYQFDGWMYLGEIVDPNTVQYEDGVLYTFVASYSPISTEEPPKESLFVPIVIVIIVVLIILGLVIWYSHL